MNTGENLSSLKDSNPKLFELLMEHPEIAVVDCYFHIEAMQFHTLYYIAERLGKTFTAAQIAEAFKIFMEN